MSVLVAATKTLLSATHPPRCPREKSEVFISLSLQELSFLLRGPSSISSTRKKGRGPRSILLIGETPPMPHGEAETRPAAKLMPATMPCVKCILTIVIVVVEKGNSKSTGMLKFTTLQRQGHSSEVGLCGRTCGRAETDDRATSRLANRARRNSSSSLKAATNRVRVIGATWEPQHPSLHPAARHDCSPIKTAMERSCPGSIALVDRSNGMVEELQACLGPRPGHRIGQVACWIGAPHHLHCDSNGSMTLLPRRVGCECWKLLMLPGISVGSKSRLR